MEKLFVAYEEFGAVGDGKTDDMPAIVKAHEYANEKGLPIKAKEGANYYIGGKDLTAKIMTNCDFRNATFTIDDRVLENIKSSIFVVESASESFIPEITSLKKNQKIIDFPHKGKVMVRVSSNERKVYIRRGLNMNSGSYISDAFVVDENGNILHGINWDYDTITTASAKSVDDEPITLLGGRFVTIANQCESKYTYHARNIMIHRSNVTVKDLVQTITGEGEHGAPYSGFLFGENCYNLKLINCTLTPHFTYKTESKVPGVLVPMGTYALQLTGALSPTFIGLTQTIDIMDRNYWGLMGTNFSKDIRMENCVVSRFDAHCGVTGGYVKNCVFGSACFCLIGFNDFVIEDTEVKAFSFFNMRYDYGAHFDGKLIAKNCTWTPVEGSQYMLNALNPGDHDFGYEACMPREILIDGFTVDDSAIADGEPLYFLPDFDPKGVCGTVSPYKVSEKLHIKNLKVKSGRKIELSPKAELYKNTSFILE